MASGETAQGRALFEELRWVHDMIRRDLAVVTRLAADVVTGMPAEDVQAEIRHLQTGGPLWQLKVNCLRYCRFVHLHHGAEDAMLFPSVRAADPELSPVVDKLESDHRSVWDLLDEVEASASQLTEDDGGDARRRVATALDALAAELLAHLEFEELSIGPALRRMTHWP